MQCHQPQDIENQFELIVQVAIHLGFIVDSKQIFLLKTKQSLDNKKDMLKISKNMQ